MARRKKKFGSPPEVHRKHAGWNAREVRRKLTHFRRHIAMGNCVDALGALTSATYEAGRLYENRASGPRYKAKVYGPGHQRALFKSEQALIKRCLKVSR